MIVYKRYGKQRRSLVQAHQRPSLSQQLVLLSLHLRLCGGRHGGEHGGRRHLVPASAAGSHRAPQTSVWQTLSRLRRSSVGWGFSESSTRSRPCSLGDRARANKRKNPEEEMSDLLSFVVLLPGPWCLSAASPRHRWADRRDQSSNPSPRCAARRPTSAPRCRWCWGWGQWGQVREEQQEKQGWLTSGRSRWTLATNCQPSVLSGTFSSYRQDVDLR